MSEQRHRPPVQLELECLRGLEEDAAGGDAEDANWSAENNSGPLWDSFEGCAQSIALLYRNPTWQTFQASAAATTQLYKESVDSQRRAYDRGLAVGRQRLLKELCGAFLTARTPSNSRHHGSGAGASPVSRTFGQMCLQSSPRSSGQPRQPQESDNPSALYMFHEALSLQSGQGGSASARSSPPRRGRQELSTFLLDELRRHRKRSHSSQSSGGNSPTYGHKRFRRL
uniref:Uncharacterized protein n=1 Tax=Plectus sambesii TaxID=2011161 RepID=A0A914VUE8_9BILA